MSKFIIINRVVFEIFLPDELIPTLYSHMYIENFIPTNYEDLIRIIVIKKDQIHYTDEDFVLNQEAKYTSEGLYQEIHNLGVFIYNRIEKQVTVYFEINESYKHNPYTTIIDTITQFILLILLDHEMMPIHASIVLPDNLPEYGVISFGNSGAGKSTLQMALHEKGCLLFADDGGLVTEDGYIHSNGLKKLAYTETTANIINTAYNQRYHISSERKTIYEIEKQRDQPVIPLVLLFPTKVETYEKPLDKISPAETLSKLMQYHVSPNYPGKIKMLYWNRFNQLVRKCSAYGYKWNGMESVDVYCHNIDLLYHIIEMEISKHEK